MMKHYIRSFNREQLLDFLDEECWKHHGTEELRAICISQLLSDSDADKYVFKDNILYTKGE